MPATEWVSVTKGYKDRHRHEPFCFNVNQSGIVEIKRFETPDERDKARDKWLAMPGAEALR